jgi:acyl-CoA thioester hydrolase
MQYLAWFEFARMELLRANGVSYAALERSGVMLLVTRAEIEYRQSVGYDEEVQIWADLGEVRSRTITFSYEARRLGDGGLLARGRTVVACTARDARVRSIPGAVVKALVGDAPAAD